MTIENVWEFRFIGSEGSIVLELEPVCVGSSSYQEAFHLAKNEVEQRNPGYPAMVYTLKNSRLVARNVVFEE